MSSGSASFCRVWAMFSPLRAAGSVRWACVIAEEGCSETAGNPPMAPSIEIPTPKIVRNTRTGSGGFASGETGGDTTNELRPVKRFDQIIECAKAEGFHCRHYAG